MARYALRTQYSGEEVYVHATIDLDWRMSVAFVMTPDYDTFPTRERAEKWAKRVLRRDPSLTIEVVEV